MTWHEQFRALAASWTLVAGLFIAACLGGFLVSNTQQSRYEASTRVAITASPLVTDPAAQVEAVRNMNQGSLLPTLAAIYSADSSGDSIGTTQVPRGYAVGSSILQQSNVVDVIVHGPDREGTAKLADELALAGGRQFASVYPTYGVRIVHDANVPAAPVSPSPRRDAAIAGIIALALGYLLALARYRLAEKRSAAAEPGAEVEPAEVEPPLEPAAVEPAAEVEPAAATLDLMTPEPILPAPSIEEPTEPPRAPKGVPAKSSSHGAAKKPASWKARRAAAKTTADGKPPGSE